MDPGQAHVETLARRLAAEAEDVRSVRHHLLATADVEWAGLAATRFRAELGRTGQRVEHLAQTVEEAAGSLRAHATAMAGPV